MTKITVITRNGEKTDIDAENGVSVMEAIRDNGFDDMLVFAVVAVLAQHAMCILTQASKINLVH